MKTKTFLMLASLFSAALLYHCTKSDHLMENIKNPIGYRGSPGDLHTEGSLYILENNFDSLIYFSGNKAAQVELIERRINAYWSINVNIDPIIFSGTSYIFTDAFIEDFDDFRIHIGGFTNALTSAELDSIEGWYDTVYAIDPFDSQDVSDLLNYIGDKSDIIDASSLVHEEILLNSLSILSSSVQLWPSQYDEDYWS